MNDLNDVRNISSSRTTTQFLDAGANVDFPTLELQIIEFWKKERIFEESLKGHGEFVFYDGPPFANGLPHYGHLLTGFVKDVYARYHTMLGQKVDRCFGWDCHGLPSEMLAEKELGISGKTAIEKYGIAKFNDYCRTSVMRYTDEWRWYVNRQARWVDWERDYKTMNKEYMESVLWVFKELYNRGLIYKSMRVMPYSWMCETPVSDFETHMDDSYREKKSQSITIGFRLISLPQSIAKISEITNVIMLVWTTTPWTLPSNLALAVGCDVEYSVIHNNGTGYIVASALTHKFEDIIGGNCVLKLLGSELVGMKYIPLFDYFAKHDRAFTVLGGDFVSTEDGTGVVHIAPGFGEDDYNLCVKHEICVVCPVDNGGRFIHPVTEYVGQQVFTVEGDIIKRIKQMGLLFKIEQYVHNYPHCWRTDTPLIYKAVDSWYLSVSSIHEKMLQNNSKIHWIPSHIKDGLFGNWLKNARDWSISRNRYWGCPIPVWLSDDPQYPNVEVYGSIAELEAAFGVSIPDLHRPFIDQLIRPNPKDPTGRSIMRRVPEVLDCWFESGAMPYAHVHYPFENADWFKTHFPADFVVEYVAQTRGWFYTLMVLSTALFDCQPFMNCICHGVILGDGGQKLSKRLKNYADPKDVFENFGSDAMRWYMMSSTIMKGQPLVIDREASGVKNVLRLVIKPLWNAYNFFILYVKIDGVQPRFTIDSTNILDKYIISKCISTIKDIKNGLNSYDSITSTSSVENFIEVLNNWYIRRSRERFWSGEISNDKLNAYNTLYTVLLLLCTAMAPLLPFITEAIYQGLSLCGIKAMEKSVHLENFPALEHYTIDEDLIRNMDRVRDACNAALRVRNNAKIRVRQPLSKVTFVGVTSNILSKELLQLVLDEINVKQWVNLPKDDICKFANKKLALNLSIIGKRITSKTQDIIRAARKGEWKFCRIDNEEAVEVCSEVLNYNEFSIKLEPNARYAKNACSLNTHDAIVVLDTNLLPELIEEGMARDVVRLIQQMRKDAALHVMDRITVLICTKNTDILHVVNDTKWQRYIMEQTLTEVLYGALCNTGDGKSSDVNMNNVLWHCRDIPNKIRSICERQPIIKGEFSLNDDNSDPDTIIIHVFNKLTDS